MAQVSRAHHRRRQGAPEVLAARGRLCLDRQHSRACLVLLLWHGRERQRRVSQYKDSNLADYAAVAPMETFIVTQGERHPTDLAGLRGARLVTTQETEKGRRWAESKIKALTGGDPITARFMRQDFFTYTPQFKLFIAGNHKPGLRGVDEAIRRRLNLVPFTITIPVTERDPELSEKLKAE